MTGPTARARSRTDDGRPIMKDRPSDEAPGVDGLESRALLHGQGLTRRRRGRRTTTARLARRAVAKRRPKRVEELRRFDRLGASPSSSNASESRFRTIGDGRRRRSDRMVRGGGPQLVEGPLQSRSRILGTAPTGLKAGQLDSGQGERRAGRPPRSVSPSHSFQDQAVSASLTRSSFSRTRPSFSPTSAVKRRSSGGTVELVLGLLVRRFRVLKGLLKLRNVPLRRSGSSTTSAAWT